MRGHNDSGGAIVERGGIAGGGDIAKLGHRTQLGQHFWGRTWAWAFIGINDGDIALAVFDLHGHDFSVEFSICNRCECALMGAGCESIGIFAADVKDLGDFLGSLGHGIGHLVHAGEFLVHKTPADRGVKDLAGTGESCRGLFHHPWCARHGFDAAGQYDIRLTGLDHGGGQRNCRHTGGAQAVDGNTRHGIRVASKQPSQARDVAVFFARAIGIADDDFIHGRGIETCFFDGLLNSKRHQVIGAYR